MKILILIFLPILAFSQDKVYRVHKNSEDTLTLIRYPHSKTITVRDGSTYKYTIPDKDTARFFYSETGEPLQVTSTYSKPGGVVQPPPPPQTVEQIVDDRNPLIKYNPAWSQYTGAAYQDGTAQYTLTVGATATLTFVGNRVQYHAEKRMNHGKAGISIDGADEVVVDLYSTETGNVKAMLFDSGPLENKEHTIRVRMRGEKNDAWQRDFPAGTAAQNLLRSQASQNNIIIDYFKYYKAQ